MYYACTIIKQTLHETPLNIQSNSVTKDSFRAAIDGTQTHKHSPLSYVHVSYVPTPYPTSETRIRLSHVQVYISWDICILPDAELNAIRHHISIDLHRLQGSAV